MLRKTAQEATKDIEKRSEIYKDHGASRYSKLTRPGPYLAREAKQQLNKNKTDDEHSSNNERIVVLNEKTVSLCFSLRHQGQDIMLSSSETDCLYP